MKEKMTRKDFLRGSLLFAGAGTLAAGTGAGILKNANAAPNAEWPYPYQELDPEYVRKLGHDSFFSGKGCCYGAFHAIIAALAEKIGEPYSSFPTEIMIFGHGGSAGWGTICGALNGAAAAISLTHEKSDSDKLVDELNGWYTQTKFPSDASNQLAVDNAYEQNKFSETLPQNESGSPLCHVSVTEWCKFAGKKVSDLERKERCGRLTGDVAAYAVQIMNANLAGTFTSSYVPPESIASCMSCHGSSGMSQVAAKMECESCHPTDKHPFTNVSNEPAAQPETFILEQNYPNPFNPQTTIGFNLPASEKVSVSVYNLKGEMVKTLIDNSHYQAGKHTVFWDGTDAFGNKVSTGVYYYRFQAGNFTKTKNMTMIK